MKKDRIFAFLRARKQVPETLFKWVIFIYLMSVWKLKYRAVCQTVPYLPHVPAFFLGSEDLHTASESGQNGLILWLTWKEKSHSKLLVPQMLQCQ